MSGEKWREVFEHHLDSRWRPHYRIMAAQLECVSRGVKPGLLWDIGPPLSRDKLMTLVDALRSRGLLAPSIHVVFIGDDHILADLGGFLARHNQSDSESTPSQSHDVNQLNQSVEMCETKQGTKFINVSKDYVTPVIVQENTESFTKIKAMLKLCTAKIENHLQIKDSNSKCVILEIEPDYCVPTLFGLLIGYPIVYWYDQTAAVLSHVHVRVFKILIERAGETGCSKYELFSFSVPSAVVEYVTSDINIWFMTLKKKCDEVHCGKIVMEVNDVLLKEVVL